VDYREGVFVEVVLVRGAADIGDVHRVGGVGEVALREAGGRGINVVEGTGTVGGGLEKV